MSWSRAAARNRSASAGSDRRRESFVGAESGEEFERHLVDAERVLLTRVVRGRIDEADQAELADVRETAEGGRVDQPSHAGSERDVDSRRQSHQRAAAAPLREFRNVVDHVAAPSPGMAESPMTSRRITVTAKYIAQ